MLAGQQPELSLNLINFGGFYNRGKTSGQPGRYLSLICFCTNTHATHTVLPVQHTDMKVGGDEWLISVEWRGRRELNELSLFWGLCMRIHCYIFTMASEKIWVSLWLRFFVSSLLRFPSLLKGESTVNISCTQQNQTNYCMFYIYQCPVHLQLSDLQI